MKTIEKYPMLMLLVGILGISLSSILVRYSAAPSAVTAAYRMLWTVLFLTPVICAKRTVREELKKTDRKTLGMSALSGVFLALHFALWFESLQHTTVASSTTIVCTEVIWVSFGYCLFLKGKISRRAAGTIAVTLAGSALIALADSSAGGVHLYGDFLALLAAMIEAAYTLLGQHVRRKTSTTVYTYIVYSACGAFLLALCMGKGYSLFGYGWSPVIVGAMLALFSTILGHSIFSWCLKYFSPSFVSASKLCEPVAAAILAGILFGEIPGGMQLFGGAMILCGVYAYSRLERAGESG